MNMWTKSIKLWLNEFTLLLLLHFRCQHRNRQEVDSIFYKNCQHLATVLRIRLSSCASTPLLPSPSSSVPIYSCRISSVPCNLCTGEVVHNCFKFLVSEVPCIVTRFFRYSAVAHKLCNWEVVNDCFLLILTDLNFVKVISSTPCSNSWF